jgi:hypothetical protein
VGACVLVIGADDVAPAEGSRDILWQAVVRAEEVPGEAAIEIIEDIAALLAADDGAGGPAQRVDPGLGRGV